MPSISRRSFIATGTAGMAMALAGCSSGTATGSQETPSRNVTATQTIVVEGFEGGFLFGRSRRSKAVVGRGCVLGGQKLDVVSRSECAWKVPGDERDLIGSHPRREPVLGFCLQEHLSRKE